VSNHVLVKKTNRNFGITLNQYY